MPTIVKELLKSDSICKSYAQMKKGPSFLAHSVGLHVTENIRQIHVNGEWHM